MARHHEELREIGFGREGAEEEVEEAEELEEMHPLLVRAAEDLLDAMQGGGYSPSVSDSDSRIERASKMAARRARAEVFAAAFKRMFEACELEPHREGPDEEE